MALQRLVVDGGSGRGDVTANLTNGRELPSRAGDFMLYGGVVVAPHYGALNALLRALVFDCHYDASKGVIAYVRVVDGVIEGTPRLWGMHSGTTMEPLEIGVLTPAMLPINRLTAGQVGYVATGLKSVQDLDVGETITLADRPAAQKLPGYQPMKPMVFAGLYPSNGDDHGDLKNALENVHLNDAARDS